MNNFGVCIQVGHSNLNWPISRNNFSFLRYLWTFDECLKVALGTDNPFICWLNLNFPQMKPLPLEKPDEESEFSQKQTWDTEIKWRRKSTEWKVCVCVCLYVPVQRSLPWYTWLPRGWPCRRSAAGRGSGSDPCGTSSCPTGHFWCPLMTGLSSCPSGQDSKVNELKYSVNTFK